MLESGQGVGAPRLASSATYAETPIDISLWEIQHNSHSRARTKLILTLSVPLRRVVAMSLRREGLFDRHGPSAPEATGRRQRRLRTRRARGGSSRRARVCQCRAKAHNDVPTPRE